LTVVTIPKNVTAIGEWAFLLCTGLTAVTIPKSVTAIGEGAFVGCKGLRAIDVQQGNPAHSSKEGVLFDRAGTTLVIYPQGKSGTYTIPQGITAIGEQAFVWCERLTAVTIPQSVTVIGDWAFEGCVGLTAVTIPGSVTSIGKYAFFACTGLTQEARSAIRARFGDAVFGE
jgi:hypothetical protein